MPDIAPGTKVLVEITATPRNAAARKTLTRLCGKDVRVAKRHRQQKDKRPSMQSWVRGGRMWEHRMKSGQLVKLLAGEKYSILATLDVLRDLESVKRWVKVARA